MKKIYVIIKVEADLFDHRYDETILKAFESLDSATSYANEYIRKEVEYAIGTWEFFGSWEDEKPTIGCDGVNKLWSYDNSDWYIKEGDWYCYGINCKEVILDE